MMPLSDAGRARAQQIGVRQTCSQQLVFALLGQVAQLTGLSASEIAAECRQTHLVEARDLVIFEAHQHGATVAGIAAALGRDWSTVRSALRREAARREAGGAS